MLFIGIYTIIFMIMYMIVASCMFPYILVQLSAHIDSVTSVISALPPR